MPQAQMNSLLVFLLLYFAKPAWSLGIDFQCPERFQNGENIVTCRINITAVSEAKCLLLSSSVTLERTVYLQTTPLCTINYDPSQPCISEAHHSPGSCWCSKTEEDIFTFSFSYLATSTLDEGGYLECKTCILPEKPLHTLVNDSCKNMSFVDYLITNDTNKSNATTVTEELSKPDNQKVEIDDSDQPASPAMIGGIISAALVLIIVIIATALFFRNRCHLLSPTKIMGSNMALRKKELSKMLQGPDEMKDNTNQNITTNKVAASRPNASFTILEYVSPAKHISCSKRLT